MLFTWTSSFFSYKTFNGIIHFSAVIVFDRFKPLLLFFSEGATVSSCDDTITTVESDTFKYFRTQFNTVTNNKITVEVRDIQGEFLFLALSPHP